MVESIRNILEQNWGLFINKKVDPNKIANLQINIKNDAKPI